MATFHQEGQTVQNQYNAETINFGGVESTEDFTLKLQALQSELNKAIEAKAITGDNSIDAEYQVKKAIAQAQSPTPDKSTLIDHLTKAKELVTGVDGLVTACAGAIALIGTLF